MKSTCIACFLMLFGSLLRLSAQQGGVFRTESLTIADGLSQGMIYDIVQTQDGFLWVATKDGLNRYDGYHFEVYTNDPFNPFSIAGNDVGRLFEDSKGNLWMNIVGKGLDVMEKTSGKFLHLPMPDLGSTLNEIPFLFTEFPDGTMLAEASSQAWRLRWKGAGTASLAQGLELVDSPDLRAYVTITPENKIQKPQTPSNKDQGTVMLSNAAGHQYMIVGSGNKTEVFAMPKNGKGGHPTLIYTADISTTALFVDRSDNCWIGTSGYGLRKINLARQPFQHFLKGQSVGKIFAMDDIYGVLHVRWETFGKLDEASGSLRPVPYLNRSVSHYFLAKNGVTYALALGSDHSKNDLLIFKNGSVEQRPIDSLSAHAHVYTSMVEDQAGDIWVTGGDGALMCYQPPSGKMSFFGLSHQFGSGVNIYALHVDAEENLWIGTSNGMAKVPVSVLKLAKGATGIPPGKFQIFQNDPANLRSLRYNFVTHFCPDPLQPERYLWVSTKGGGLNLLDKTSGDFQHFTSRNSDLPNDVVYGILEGEKGEQVSGELWISTNRGLSRLTIANCQPPTANCRTYRFRNFRASDGLQDDEFNTASFARSSDGRLFFGGVNGLTAFYPSEIEGGETDAPVRLTGLKINNLPVDYFQKSSPLDRPLHRTESIRLDYTQNLVTLEFALVDFQNPKENRFRYRLEGVDPDWVEAGTSHAANYAHLRPGHYLFEVQGSVSGGTWSEPASLRITVLPPWWATWWAYSVYFLLILGAAFAIFSFFRKRLLLQNALKLEHEEANRLKELDSFKSRLFTNLTHEFRTPLTVILGLAQQLGAGDKDKAKISSGLKLIENNGKSLLRLINQLLDLSKLENNAFQLHLQLADIVPYLRYVTESFQTYANSKNLSLRFFTTLEKLDMDFDPEQIKQVLTNLISNGVKFTPPSGEVKVSVGMRNEERGMKAALLLTVADTGIGIAEKDLPHVFDRFFQADNTNTRPGDGTGIGLAHTQELVKIMGGSISVESKVGVGTSFKVELPITHNSPKTELAADIQPFFAEQVIEMEPQEKQSVSSDAPTILLVEDNPDVVLYLKSCLENQYQLEVAYNGKIGIEKSLELIPDLVISDVMMPEKDGYQVCDTLKNDLRTSHIPIILLTAKADAASRMAGLRRGADAYLSKPFDVEELLVRVSVLLENQRRVASYFSQNLQLGKTAPVADAALSEAVQVEDAFVKKVNEIIEANYMDEDFALPQLCQKIGMSRSQLFRKMKAVTNTAPSDLIRSYRLKKAKLLLETEGLNVAEAAYQVGFKDPSYFSKLFQEEFGFQPSATNK